jgi:copper chaperone CopZ
VGGAAEPLEGFNAIQIEVGQREFEVTYDPSVIDEEAIKTAVDASGQTCKFAE